MFIGDNVDTFSDSAPIDQLYKEIVMSICWPILHLTDRLTINYLYIGNAKNVIFGKKSRP